MRGRQYTSVVVALATAWLSPTLSRAQTVPSGAQTAPSGAAGSPAAEVKALQQPPLGSQPTSAEPLPSPVDLMARIRLLEKRLADVEDRKRGPAAPKPPTAPKSTTASKSLPAAPATAAVPSSEQVPSPIVLSAPVPAAPVTTVAKTAPTAAPTDSSLQASFMFRDTAPTLATNKSEIALDGTYVRNVRAGGNPFTQFDRLFAGAVEAKFGVGNGFEIGGSASYFSTSRLTRGALLVDEELHGLGDIRLNLSKQLWAPTTRLPGMALSFGVETPTGLTRYDDVKRIIAIQEASVTTGAGNARDQSPFSPFLPSVASRGHWAASANAQFFKTFDPVVVFFGMGVNYALARDFEGNTFQPGLRFTYNAGLSLALSEHTTLGFQYSGSIEQRFKATIRTYNDGSVRRFTDPSQESSRARFVVIQRLDEGLYIEPSITMGLTDDTPDVTVGIALRKRM
jgi:opacity protein-like surface antigen